MANYEDMRVKLTNTKLDKLKFAGKTKTGIMLRLNRKTLKMKNCHLNYS